MARGDLPRPCHHSQAETQEVPPRGTSPHSLIHLCSPRPALSLLFGRLPSSSLVASCPARREYTAGGQRPDPGPVRRSWYVGRDNKSPQPGMRWAAIALKNRAAGRATAGSPSRARLHALCRHSCSIRSVLVWPDGRTAWLLVFSPPGRRACSCGDWCLDLGRLRTPPQARCTGG